MSDNSKRGEDESVKSFLEWVSTVFSKRFLAVLVTLVVVVALASAAVAAYTLTSTMSYKEALEIQAAQLTNLKALFDLHNTIMEQARAEMERALITPTDEFLLPPPP